MKLGDEEVSLGLGRGDAVFDFSINGDLQNMNEVDIIRNMDGEYQLNLNNFKIKLENINADINPISLGLKTLIHNWESKKNIELMRKDDLITVQLNGDIYQPMIRLPNKYVYLFEME